MVIEALKDRLEEIFQSPSFRVTINNGIVDVSKAAGEQGQFPSNPKDGYNIIWRVELDGDGNVRTRLPGICTLDRVPSELRDKLRESPRFETSDPKRFEEFESLAREYAAAYR